MHACKEGALTVSSSSRGDVPMIFNLVDSFAQVSLQCFLKVEKEKLFYQNTLSIPARFTSRPEA